MRGKISRWRVGHAIGPPTNSFQRKKQVCVSFEEQLMFTNTWGGLMEGGCK